jgi:hypothetical protein
MMQGGGLCRGRTQPALRESEGPPAASQASGETVDGFVLAGSTNRMPSAAECFTRGHAWRYLRDRNAHRTNSRCR